MYSDQESRLEKAFRQMTTSCSVDCNCGKTHFVACDGHGDYEPGELERMITESNDNPRYCAEWQFDTIDTVIVDGKEYVVGCECAGYQRYLVFIEAHADQLATYLKLFFECKAKEADRAAENARGKLAELSEAKP